MARLSVFLLNLSRIIGNLGITGIFYADINLEISAGKALNDRDIELHGQIGSTGLAVMDSGDIDTLQQVDLVA